MTNDQIRHMVDRFLMWKLPANFAPDAGISFKAIFNEYTPHPMKHEPIGTNLFDATQAEAMVRHMLEGLPDPRPPDAMPQEIERLARLAVQQKDEQERRMAAMTPGQRAAEIEEWAARLAPQMVAEATAYDALFTSATEKLKEPSPAALPTLSLRDAVRVAREWFDAEAEHGQGDAWKMRDMCDRSLAPARPEEAPPRREAHPEPMQIALRALSDGKIDSIQGVAATTSQPGTPSDGARDQRLMFVESVLRNIKGYCEHMFSPGWLADPANRSIFAARVYAMLRAPPPEEKA